MPGKNRTTGKKSYTLGQRQRSQFGLFDVELPSGDTCQAKRPGVQGLIQLGLLDNFDQLTAIVQMDHIAPNTPVAARPKVTDGQMRDAAVALMNDPEALGGLLHMLDKLVAGIVVQPPVWIDYQVKDETDEAWEARQAKAEADDAVAVREIDMDDKMFLMNWAVGGSADLAAFRKGRAGVVVDLPTGESL